MTDPKITPTYIHRNIPAHTTEPNLQSLIWPWDVEIWLEACPQLPPHYYCYCCYSFYCYWVTSLYFVLYIYCMIWPGLLHYEARQVSHVTFYCRYINRVYSTFIVWKYLTQGTLNVFWKFSPRKNTAWCSICFKQNILLYFRYWHNITSAFIENYLHEKGTTFKDCLV